MNDRRSVIGTRQLVLLGAAATCLWITPGLAQGISSPLESAPYSGAVLVARALAAGRIALSATARAANAPVPALTCGPAPCVFPNSQASGGGNPANEDPIAADPNNPQNLLTAANDYNCSTLQGYYASTDGGSTWTRTCGVVLAGQTGDGDPIVGYDLNGVAYRGGISASSSNVGVIVVSHSSDHGATWSAPVKAATNVLGGFADKPWMEIDTNPSSPFKNRIYVSTTQFNLTGTKTAIAVARSLDGGATWTTAVVTGPTSLPVVNQFTDLAVGADGTVYLAWMTCTESAAGTCAGTTAQMLFSKSADGGQTWSTPSLIKPAVLAPDNGCGAFYGCLPNTRERVSNIPVIAVDNSTRSTAGRLYVAYYTWTGRSMVVGVTSSSDGGATWGAPKAVSRTAHDQFFPWINVSNTGLVGVTWLDRRNDPANISYDAFGAVSTNGGATYRTAKISAHISNPNNDGFGGQFMGDYTGNAWAGNSLYASWMDTSNGVNSQDMVGGGLISAGAGPSASATPAMTAVSQPVVHPLESLATWPQSGSDE